MKIKHKLHKVSVSRRRLLGSAVGIGAAGVGLGALGVATAQQTVATEAAKPKTGSGEYRETEHIRRYYQTAW